MEDALVIPGTAPKSAAPTAARRKLRLLDRHAFDALLAALHPDRNEAAERYAALRERLSRFFAWNRAEDPDAHADEVMDRVARRVATGTTEDEAVRQPEKFAVGVARMLLRELWREQKASAQMISSLQIQSSSQNQLQQEQQQIELRSQLLEQCLQELPASQQDLIRRYYSTESRTQIDARKTLAAEFNISLNALRNRALRIRAEVERSARKRFEQNSL